ncbi:MAG: hypothetical protein Q4F54_01905 [Coriobacteriia bacterium]|nr:hypothetical protein [Coriobacteriia bacterium]
MDKALIDEIVKRVEEKLAEMGQVEGASSVASANEEVTYTRRLLSEKDIIEHNKAGKTKIVYSKCTIVTDVAKDYAKQFNIELIEQN